MFTKVSEQVYEFLLRQISTQAFPPGTLLRELDLVSQLGVSRTPIREALLRLTENGLVETSGRTNRVRRLEKADVIHIYQMRRALEGLAISLACGRFSEEDFARLDAQMPSESQEASPQFDEACFRLDMELHRLIALRSGNPLLVQEIRKLHHLVQLAHKPISDLSGRLREVKEELRQHVRIIAALKAGDRPGSREALSDHLRFSCQVQIRCLRDAARAPGAGDAVGSSAASADPRGFPRSAS
jgi:DNA-binding GntR family transcriptional regulator